MSEGKSEQVDPKAAPARVEAREGLEGELKVGVTQAITELQAEFARATTAEDKVRILGYVSDSFKYDEFEAWKVVFYNKTHCQLLGEEIPELIVQHLARGGSGSAMNALFRTQLGKLIYHYAEPFMRRAVNDVNRKAAEAQGAQFEELLRFTDRIEAARNEIAEEKRRAQAAAKAERNASTSIYDLMGYMSVGDKLSFKSGATADDKFRWLMSYEPTFDLERLVSEWDDLTPAPAFLDFLGRIIPTFLEEYVEISTEKRGQVYAFYESPFGKIVEFVCSKG
ncbi:hypothetical protein HOD30_02715 [Candidatus Peregrinibacteria bacterium]|jgi:hypothetical protein|nr:hypothetical protein [Candidatus Peregrinibacteria bacterium]MBT4631830.1 hypothetical protein [Candidatus Peregrinibacteria bacterium]MBT5517282.1 hypothetical protein [Candidatus Peregrinibacteria bacterium]MBT5824445.1 hypothetical protein [Candidatus Peregrinibacteria bacterium]